LWQVKRKTEKSLGGGGRREDRGWGMREEE